jgi:protein subunit release factor B
MVNFPVELAPEILKKAEDLKLNPADFAEQFIRGSGKGGQKINKTSSCVQLRHLPTGIEVRCQVHREQSKNRLSAYKLLINKIEARILGFRSEYARAAFKKIKQKRKRSKRAKEKVLRAKHARSAVKATRGPTAKNSDI